MSIILFLAVAAITVAGGFLGAFIWATKDGQYDDTYTPSIRMLFDNPQKENTDITPKVDWNHVLICLLSGFMGLVFTYFIS